MIHVTFERTGPFDVALGLLGARRHALSGQGFALSVEDLPVPLLRDLLVEALEVDRAEALDVYGVADFVYSMEDCVRQVG